MSGHSKWSTIKRKKAKTDAQKGKAFSKVVREIMIAVKIGGSDSESNGRLRLALQKAKEVNMPADNVKRAIKKGEGPQSGDALEEVTFEAYGPFGVAILIKAVTDNRNRTVPNLRILLNKAGGSLATAGSVSYLFQQKGIFVFAPNSDEDAVLEVALEADAEDVKTNEDESIEVLTEPTHYDAVKEAFDKAGLKYEVASISMIPDNSVILDQSQSEKILRLLDQLEEDEDVQEVFANEDIPEDILAELV